MSERNKEPKRETEHLMEGGDVERMEGERLTGSGHMRDGR